MRRRRLEGAEVGGVESGLLSLSRLRALQEESFAEDVPIESEMQQWTEKEALDYFASGGRQRPDITNPPTLAAANACVAAAAAEPTTKSASKPSRSRMQPRSTSLPPMAMRDSASAGLLVDMED